MTGKWTVKITDKIAATIRSLPPEQKRRIRDAIRILEDDGEAGKSLIRELTGFRALPVKPLRVIYTIVGHEVRLRMIERRETVYEILATALRSAEPSHRRRLLQTARYRRPGSRPGKTPPRRSSR